jgi:hypothetical protein
MKQLNLHREMQNPQSMFGGEFGCAPAFPWAFWSKQAKKAENSWEIQTQGSDGNSMHAKW